MNWDLPALICGFIALYIGAELLISGGTRVATAIGISPMVVGLTVIAFGTSLPEMTVGVISAIHGSPDIAMGNVVGSNICNILLIFGIIALIRPLRIKKEYLRKDVPAVLASAALLWILSADGVLGRLDGVILLVSFAVFLVHTWDRRKARDVGTNGTEYLKHLTIDIVKIVSGLAILIFGGKLCIHGGTGLAASLGIPNYIVGLTVIAVGTSLPELAVGVLATIKRETGLPVGNALGSNIFNALSVIGVTAVIRPFTIDSELLEYSMPIMLLATMAFLPLAQSGKRLSRLEGAGFLVFYLVYILSITL